MSDSSNGSPIDAHELGSLALLEERILATVEQLRATRREKAQAESEAVALREQLAQAEQRNRELARELDSFRAERRQISQRLEHLLSQIDLLARE